MSVAHHTPNDPHFTYFLHIFHLQATLHRLLHEYKQPDPPDHTHETNDLSARSEQVSQGHRLIQEYLGQSEDAGCALGGRVAEDQRRIAAEGEGGCMVKLEIQSLEVVKGVSSIRLTQEGGRAAREEHLLIGRTRSQHIYREFLFPAPAGRIRLATDPVPSALTIDVEDIAKAETLCEVFAFKAQKEEFGFVALRLQFVSGSEAYRRERRQRVVMLEKELRLCEKGRAGL